MFPCRPPGARGCVRRILDCLGVANVVEAFAEQPFGVQPLFQCIQRVIHAIADVVDVAFDLFGRSACVH